MNDPAAMSRTDRRKRERREALVQAALDLFRERGLYGTRVEDITERADTAKGAFYNHFASKDALVAELLSGAVRVLEHDYLSTLNGQSGPARIEELSRLHGRFLDEHPTYALLLHQTRGLLLVPASDPVEALRDIFREYLNAVARALGHGQARATHREVAAVIAGAVAGARAFSIAAGWKPSRAAPSVLARGVGRALASRKRQAR
jgi:AcrR family transcriptional regulator